MFVYVLQLLLTKVCAINGMSGLGNSVELLESVIGSLENSVTVLGDKTENIDAFNETLQSKLLFDVLPERLVLQKPLKIRKMVKPMLEKDLKQLDNILERLKKRQINLQQQSKLLKLKLESLDS